MESQSSKRWMLSLPLITWLGGLPTRGLGGSLIRGLGAHEEIIA